MPDYRAIARAAAVKYGINPAIFLRQISQESGFDPYARSGAGAVGIAQIVPRWHPDVNPLNPVASLNWAARTMAEYIQKYGGWAPALSAYNSGQPDKYRDPNFASGQTYNYVKTILAGQNPSAPVLTAPGASQRLTAPVPQELSPASLAAFQNLMGSSAPTGASFSLPTRLNIVPAVKAQGPIAPSIDTNSVPRGQFQKADRGKIIGTPYSGTHTLGNWESDNAIDISLRKGTPIYAPVSGTIGSQIGPLNSSNPRMAGLRLHLSGAGNEFYFAHLSRLLVKAGQRVRAGQLIGYSGVANGVPHLHLATRVGNPQSVVGI